MKNLVVKILVAVISLSASFSGVKAYSDETGDSLKKIPKDFSLQPLFKTNLYIRSINPVPDSKELHLILGACLPTDNLAAGCQQLVIPREVNVVLTNEFQKIPLSIPINDRKGLQLFVSDRVSKYFKPFRYYVLAPDDVKKSRGYLLTRDQIEIQFDQVKP